MKNLQHLKKTFILQQDKNDCGVASIASIIKYHGGNISLERLRDLSGTTTQGTTMLGLYQAAQKVGFDVDALEADGVSNLSDIREPAILHVLMKERLQHYLVFYGFDGNNAIVGDPGTGVIYLSKEELNIIWRSKALLSLRPNKNFKKETNETLNKKVWLLSLIKEDKNSLIVTVFIGIILAILSLSTAVFSQKLIDVIIPSGSINKLTLGIVLLTILLFARSVLSLLRGLIIIRQASDFNKRIISSFYANLLYLPKSFFDSRKIGDMIARMNDTKRIQTVVSTLAGNILIDFLVLIVSITFIFFYSSIAGITMLVSIPIYVFLGYHVNKSIAKAQREVMSSYAYSESNYVDSIQGILAIKSANHESYFQRLNKQVYGKYQDKVFVLGNLGIKFGWRLEILGILFTIIIFAIASKMVLHEQLSIGEMIAVLSMAGGVIPCLMRIVSANFQLQEARVAFDRMFEFISIIPEYSQSEDKFIKISFHKLEFQQVSFRFPGRKQILNNVSLHLQKGEMIALLGESGGGKSTLIQLAQKFYNPESGKILIDDREVQSVPTQYYRENIGIVPQEIKIFNGSLLYNIVLSDSTEDFAKAIKFCQEKGFNKFFEELPQGYSTIVGEEGINLSGGQKQLVAIVRALVRSPKILLLDEATSGMDRNLENFILDTLSRLKELIAILVVTHKIKTAQRCDRIYILETGKTVLSGKPIDLMQTDNFYSKSILELMTT